MNVFVFLACLFFSVLALIGCIGWCIFNIDDVIYGKHRIVWWKRPIWILATAGPIALAFFVLFIRGVCQGDMNLLEVIKSWCEG